MRILFSPKASTGKVPESHKSAEGGKGLHLSIQSVRAAEGPIAGGLARRQSSETSLFLHLGSSSNW